MKHISKASNLCSEWEIPPKYFGSGVAVPQMSQSTN